MLICPYVLTIFKAAHEWGGWERVIAGAYWGMGRHSRAYGLARVGLVRLGILFRLRESWNSYADYPALTGKYLLFIVYPSQDIAIHESFSLL
jgi:hypothetical protein